MSKPLLAGALVAADVDRRVREDLHHGVQGVATKTQRSIGEVDVVFRHPEGGARMADRCSTAQLGVGGHHRLGVSRKIDFRDDRDAQQLSSLVDGAQLVDGVGTTVGYVVVLSDVVTAVVVGWRLVPSYRSWTPRAHRGQPRPARYRQTPPLIVSEMQVQPIELVHGQHVQKTHDERGGHEMSRNVQMGPAPTVVWRIDDDAFRKA